MPAHFAAHRAAEELRELAAVLESIEIVAPHHHVNTSLSRSELGPPEIDVHDVQPDELERVLELYPEATPHHDGDAILRYVSASIRGVNVTFYRR